MPLCTIPGHGQPCDHLAQVQAEIHPGPFPNHPHNKQETVMARMRAVMAAVQVMEKEGITQAFGVPGAAINPMYAALKERQSIAHILARHVEGASHMA